MIPKEIKYNPHYDETTGVFKALLWPANFTLCPDATLNTEIHKNSVRIKASNSVNASKRKHKNQITLIITIINKDEYSWQFCCVAE